MSSREDDETAPANSEAAVNRIQRSLREAVTTAGGVAESARQRVEDSFGAVRKRVGGSRRENVLMARVDDEVVRRIDDLVEADLFSTKSEAAYFLLNEGIKSRRDLFDGISQNIDTIRKAKAALQELREQGLREYTSDLGATLSAGESTRPNAVGRGRRRSREGLPQKDYEAPILITLQECGGSGRSKDILESVELKLRHRLQPVDYESVKGGRELRWHNLASWARKDLVELGLLRDDSLRGTWELTAAGMDAASQLSRGESSTPL